MEDRKVLVAILGSAMIGAVAGAVGAIVSVPRAGESVASTAALERELRALSEAIKGAVPRLEALAERDGPGYLVEPPPVSHERTEVGGVGDATPFVAGLDEHLARLEGILERAASAAASAASGVRAPPGRLGTPDFPPKEEVNSREFRGRHLLWDYARVLEGYGYPDVVEKNTSQNYLRWKYHLRDGRKVWFDFFDGIVMRTGGS